MHESTLEAELQQLFGGGKTNFLCRFMLLSLVSWNVITYFDLHEVLTLLKGRALEKSLNFLDLLFRTFKSKATPGTMSKLYSGVNNSMNTRNLLEEQWNLTGKRWNMRNLVCQLSLTPCRLV